MEDSNCVLKCMYYFFKMFHFNKMNLSISIVQNFFNIEVLKTARCYEMSLHFLLS